MLLQVRLYATLRRYQPSIAKGILTIDMPAASSVAEVVKHLAIDPAEIHIVMVNGIGSELDRILVDDDRVGLFPALGGG